VENVTQAMKGFGISSKKHSAANEDDSLIEQATKRLKRISLSDTAPIRTKPSKPKKSKRSYVHEVFTGLPEIRLTKCSLVPDNASLFAIPSFVTIFQNRPSQQPKLPAFIRLPRNLLISSSDLFRRLLDINTEGRQSNTCEPIVAHVTSNLNETLAGQDTIVSD